MKLNLENTYWGGAGTHQATVEKLQALIPDEGSVPDADENPSLETFRIASNCYYDLYNNGLCNRGAEFREVFGFGPGSDNDDEDYDRFRDDGTDYHSRLDQAEVQKIERRMTKIIIAAAKEQGVKP